MASLADIAVAMKRLTDAMPPPRGVDAGKAFSVYGDALMGFSVEEIEAGIGRYLRGECDDVSLKFYPRPPELAKIIRGVRLERAREHERQLRADRMAAERAEVIEAGKLAKKTPDQLRRATEIHEAFKRSHAAAQLEGIGSRGQRERREAERLADESRRIRETYGMTDEALAKVRDSRPLPKGMQQAGAALPGLPEPESFAELSDDEIERRYGGGA